MSSQTKVADEYAFIASRMAEIEREKKEAQKVEGPKQQEHDYSAIYTGTYEDMVAWPNFSPLSNETPSEEWVFDHDTYLWIKPPC